MPLIKAAVCHKFGAPLKIEDVELRAPEGAEVEVTLDAVAICHSDISFGNLAIPVGTLIFLKLFGKFLPPSSLLPKYIQLAELKVLVIK